MSKLTDPAAKEEVKAFIVSSRDILLAVEATLEAYEDNPDDNSVLEKFSQQIDSVLKGAVAIGAEQINTICQLCHVIGLKASQSINPDLTKMVAGVLLAAVDFMSLLLEDIESGKTDMERNTNALINRLNWISNKFKQIESEEVPESGPTQENKVKREKVKKSAETTAHLDSLINKLN